jgi:hypothetical protein
LISLFLMQLAPNHTADDGRQASQSEASASGPPKIAVAVERLSTALETGIAIK